MKKSDAAAAINLVLEAPRAVNTAELAEELIAAFGGPRRFAGQYKTEFDGAKAGSISRSKMLDGVLRIITAAGAQNKGRQGAGEPSGMDDEALVAEMTAILVRRGIIPGAEHGPAEEGAPAV